MNTAANEGLWGHSSTAGDPLGYIIAASSMPTVKVIMDPDLGPPSKVLIGCWHGEMELAYLYGLSRLLVKPRTYKELYGTQDAVLWLHPDLDARDRRTAYLVPSMALPVASGLASNVEIMDHLEKVGELVGVFMSTTKEAIGVARGAGILDCYTLDPTSGEYYVATQWPANFVSVGGPLEAKAPAARTGKLSPWARDHGGSNEPQYDA